MGGQCGKYGEREKLCLVLVGNLKERVQVWCECRLFLWGEQPGSYHADTVFDFRKAKSETKEEKYRPMLSAEWCDLPRGMAKRDFFWGILFWPYNCTVWRYRTHWTARSPDFTASESPLWLDLESEVCATRPDLPKKWQSSLQGEMEQMTVCDWSKLYRNWDGHYGNVSNVRELIYTLCTPFRVC